MPRFRHTPPGVGSAEELVRALIERSRGGTRPSNLEIEEALEQGPSIVRWVTFTGGLLGATGGFALCWYTIYTWPMVIGGTSTAVGQR